MLKLNKSVLLFLLFILFVFTASSQISQITNTISIEEIKTCTTNFYDEVQNVYGSCIYYNNYTICLNTSGPNTACSPSQNTWTFRCKTGEITLAKNSTECKPNDKFVISIDKGTATLKKQLDYSEWGHCIYNVENACLVVTCQSRYDGANDGQFHGCKGGTSCQRFEICDNSIKTFYKNSREGFAEYDPSFHLNKLYLAEVAK